MLSEYFTKRYSYITHVIREKNETTHAGIESINTNIVSESITLGKKISITILLYIP